MPMSAMNARERVLAAIRHQPVDRIPTDIWATPEVWRRLQDYAAGRDLNELLHLDGMPGVGARYVGPPPPPAPAGEEANFWGMRYRRVDYGSGAYQEQCFCPLAAATAIDDLERYVWPRAEWFDCSAMRAQAERIRQTHVVACGYMAPLYFHTQLRGLEQALVDPLLEPEFTRHLLARLCDFFYRQHRAMFEACAGLIDVAQVTDDLGSQTGPLLSVEVWREFYRPHTQRFIDLCREFGIHVFHHDDGAIRPFLPDLAEMGVEILNPIQWRCPGMEVEGLKRDFGGAFCFHGAIDNQQTLPHGTPEAVRAEVRHMIDVLAADGTGYILAPCHAIQPVTPLANILAMYDEAWRYGPRG